MRRWLPAGYAARPIFRQKSDEAKLTGGQAGGDERAECGVGAGNGEDGYSGGDGLRGEPCAWIADAGHACVGDQGDAAAGFEGVNEFGGAVPLVGARGSLWLA